MQNISFERIAIESVCRPVEKKAATAPARSVKPATQLLALEDGTPLRVLGVSCSGNRGGLDVDVLVLAVDDRPDLVRVEAQVPKRRFRHVVLLRRPQRGDRRIDGRFSCAKSAIERLEVVDGDRYRATLARTGRAAIFPLTL